MHDARYSLKQVHLSFYRLIRTDSHPLTFLLKVMLNERELKRALDEDVTLRLQGRDMLADRSGL